MKILPQEACVLLLWAIIDSQRVVILNLIILLLIKGYRVFTVRQTDSSYYGAAGRLIPAAGNHSAQKHGVTRFY